MMLYIFLENRFQQDQKWKMLLIEPEYSDSCFCTKCCANDDCSYISSTTNRRIANNEKDCLKLDTNNFE